MSRTVRLLAGVSLLLIAAAFWMARLGFGSGGGFVPIADPTDVMFHSSDEPGEVWIGIGMILLLGGLSTAFATVRCWIHDSGERKGFARHATGIVPRT